MASQRWLSKVFLPAWVGLGLSACIAIPVQEHGYGYRGHAYGGSGYSSVNPSVARDKCLQVVQYSQRYQSVSAGSVDITGPQTAQVQLRVVRPFGARELLGCTYNARTDRAFLR